VLRNALAPSPEFPCRAAASTRRSAALPPLRLPLLASPACACRVDAFSAQNRGLELEIKFAGEVTARAAASPLAAGRTLASVATGSRSSAQIQSSRLT
jgi:hypothetical protein